ncbi:putative wall-associated receptor kinase, galacturonan-binding domain-containing protein [Medicago truncatula]|uniref:RING-type E3 ubiquitin transferase n=1 Tax=Medicago truncatula TaxID=3880 RepID=G7I953_MEDTR|nr:wall-associated receptor kinase galacturonan-binding protein [Medicago truncatula]RHN77976.1 putative wall-associated receptor kinase, galacturonan-binding domain-containing protein [Medicago truncatula]
MNTYYGLLLFMVYFVVRTTTAMVNNSADLTCGNQVIKFPFHIKNHNPNPSSYGYPGFELFCSSNNETMIELPHSMKLNVKNIDYRHQTM